MRRQDRVAQQSDCWGPSRQWARMNHVLPRGAAKACGETLPRRALALPTPVGGHSASANVTRSFGLPAGLRVRRCYGAAAAFFRLALQLSDLHRRAIL